ncbi:MAG: EamA family transporter [Lachnospiraceae bacterium]|nr:EamA family transporter [Lachnospiraceae bacterium]
MTSRYVLAMFLSVAVASISQVLLKKSAMNRHKSVVGEYLNPCVISGYGLLFLSMLLTVYAYSGMEYKNGPVIESLGNVMVLALGYFVFGERISVRKMVGTACIVAGIAVFSLA